MAVDDDEAQILAQWSHRLAQALQLLDLEFDQEQVLDLARTSARSVTHAAAPITTLMVGYAAGLAVGSGGGVAKEGAPPHAPAARPPAPPGEGGAPRGPASKGWADTAQ